MHGPDKKLPTISFDDFVAYRPMHNYIFLPTREPWPASSVDAQLPPVALLDEQGEPVLDKKGNPRIIPAHVWLDINRPVHQMTWTPATEMLIRDRVVADGGWIEKVDAVCLNLYMPPTVVRGDARKAKPWIDHIRKVYPKDADHIIKWLAHRVQRPADKINHALMLGGSQGIGKDTLLEPVKHSVGPWNFAEVSPTQMLGRFNGYLKSVILRISEARDLGESNRFAAYDHTKTYAAAPPDTLRVDEKHLREHYVINCCGLIITSNYLTDGIYLPADDRRHYVAWSDLTKDDFNDQYWQKLWKWYADGGIKHVAAYLAKLDLSKFDPKAPPPKTAAFWRIVDANRATEEGELADIIEKLGNPAALTLNQVVAMADEKFGGWLEDRKNRRSIPHRFELVNYIPVRNSDAESGLWRIDTVVVGHSDKGPHYSIGSERQVIYVLKTLSLKDQLAAAARLRDAATSKAKAIITKKKAPIS